MTDTQPTSSIPDTAQAVIRKVWPTGLYFEHGLEIGLELVVTRPGQAPYPVETRHIIASLTAAQFQPGQPLGLVVDPSNPRRVIITEVLAQVSRAASERQSSKDMHP